MTKSFVVPIKTLSLNETSGEHWSRRDKRAKKQREDTALAWVAYLGPWRPTLPCSVKLTRIAFSDGLDSHDNLRAALKHVVDAITDILGLPADNDERVTWEYDQERAPIKKYFAVRIEIEEQPT